MHRPRHRSSIRVVVGALLAIALPLLLLGGAPGAVAAKKKKAAPVPQTVHHLPFVCNTAWTGSTRKNHSPSANSLDFNAPNDLRKPVLASAAGTVTKAVTKLKTGYGKHVVIDHGNGESSVYAHLRAVTVKVGAWVDQGALIGRLGSTGNSTGPHLHFEQKVGKVVAPSWFARKEYAHGTSRSGNCVDSPLSGDLLEGDGDDLAVFRRQSKGRIVVRAADGSERPLKVGRGFFDPVVGDWNGDGKEKVGAWNPSTRVFTLAGESGFEKIKFGALGDRPVAGDWDGDGRTDLGVRRSSNASFVLRAANGTTSRIALGKAADLPVVGDWNGDGVDDLGVYDPRTATFSLRTVTQGRATISSVVFGSPGDLPVAGDWDGDGVDEVGTWTPSTATFTQRLGAGVARTAKIRFGRAR